MSEDLGHTNVRYLVARRAKAMTGKSKESSEAPAPTASVGCAAVIGEHVNAYGDTTRLNQERRDLEA